MMMSGISTEEKDGLDRRFQAFLKKLMTVGKFKPKEKYLYPIMKGVPFRDLEVALDLAMIEKNKANDNDA